MMHMMSGREGRNHPSLLEIASFKMAEKKQRFRLTRVVPFALLAGWSLIVNYGSTYPKDGSSIAGPLITGSGGPLFKTKAACDKRGGSLVREFYAEARRRGEKVDQPTTFKCKERLN
jgi:hypothetical protein